jgi:uncharacterized protein
LVAERAQASAATDEFRRPERSNLRRFVSNQEESTMPAPTLVVGAPCWIDLYSSDTDKATEFYGTVFGWTTESAGPEFGGTSRS